MKLQPVICIIALLQFQVSTLFAQMDNCRYAEVMDSLFFQEDGDKRPGYSVAIVKDDSIIYQRSIGQINVERKIAFDENSVFAIASCSKQFTAFGILLLEQEGKLKLTDDIRKYIPELPEYENPILIKHLLSHTSGIRDHIIWLGWENRQSDRFYNFLGTLKCLENYYTGTSFSPGDDFAYTNTGFVLLAFIAERVSGKPFDVFMKESIFDPLEMDNTEFSTKRKYKEFGFSRPYNYNWKSKKFLPLRTNEINATGAVGIYTTMNDYIKWDQNFTTMTVGNEALFQRYLTSDTLNNGMKVNYNNGLKERMFRGHHVVEHSGGWAFYNFQHTRIPELGLSIIIASNNEFDYPIGMTETFLKEVITKERVPSSELRGHFADPNLIGTYRSDDFTTRTIKNRDGRTFISGKGLYGAKEFELYPVSENVFIDSTGNKLIFDSENERFRWSGGGYFNNPKQFHAFDTTSIDFQKLEGIYSCEELGKIRIKYNRKKQSVRIKPSFGKRPKIKQMRGNQIDLSGVDYSIMVQDENTLVLGNSWLFNVIFKRDNE